MKNYTFEPNEIMIIIAIAVVFIIVTRWYYKNKYLKIENELRHKYYLKECELKSEIENQKKKKQRLYNDFVDQQTQLKKEIKRLTDKYNEALKDEEYANCKLLAEQQKFIEIIKNDPPFDKIKSLVADAQSLIFDQAESYLIEYRSAYKAADVVKELKHKYRELSVNYKELQYKYEYMLSQFPELSNYIEEHLYEVISGSEDDDYDHARNWLPQEEYERLCEDERNQKALDNWVKGHKRTNSEVGYDYEMYIGYRFRSSSKFKWKVDQYGISRGLNDLGRDIIATREDPQTGDTIVCVVQCKYWSQEKQIHENVIAQLYGTAKMYQLEHKDDFRKRGVLKVFPTLMTSTNLSETAERFAKFLGVRIQVEPMLEYPRIKCNINKSTGHKIYHLPFDQQYYNVKIENEDEFYAFTVAEAVSKGFRRAHRYILS